MATSSIEIGTECLSWGVLGLALILWNRWYIPNRQHALGVARSTWNGLIWAASICIASSRLIPLYYSVTPALPLVTVATELALHLVSRANTSLPGWEKGNVTRPGSRWVRTAAMVGLGVWCHLLLRSEDSYLGWIIFALLRTASFVLLEVLKERGDFASPNEGWLGVEAIVLRVFGMTAVAIVVLAHSLAWSMAWQVLLNVVELGTTFYMVLIDCTVSATTIRTYTTLAAKGFTSGSVMSSVQGAIALSPSAVGRLLLIPLIVLFTLPTLTNHLCSDIIQGDRTGLNPSIHPIAYLATEAEAKFQQMVDRQSKTLDEACAEYRRRYGREPPPYFDVWFETAQLNDVVLVDEFDSMMASLDPLWGVPAAVLRRRVEDALGSDQTFMLRFEFNDHRLKYPSSRFGQWMSEQIYHWFTWDIKDTLPSSFTFAMNIMDEPNVVVPHDVLESLAEDGARPGHGSGPSQGVEFLELSNQTSDLVMSSCSSSPEQKSQSRSPKLSELGFLSDVSLSKDICQFPNLRHLHGLLQSPESLNLTQTLVPIFSQGRLSCFQDLLIPSPFYTSRLDRHEYQEDDDRDWDEKSNTVYWRGSTTGGHSTVRNWQSLQRQRLALLVRDKNKRVKFMKKAPSSTWTSVDSTLSSISSALDIQISNIVQCEPDACAEQNNTFRVTPSSPHSIEQGYAARYNVDLDGNGFSGRFYRHLRSKSTPIKQTLFQEWHDDWLIPWVHYIPLSMELDEFPEMARYLTMEEEGKRLGRKIAGASREWAGKVLRKADIQMFVWRLMLEYARVMDESRDMEE